jgi:hypothetical protein
LGDCGDRGTDSWKLIKAVLSNSQFIYIKGNHEEMLIDAGREFLKSEMNDLSWVLLTQNGGYDTFEDWLKEDHNAQWLNVLDKLPIFAKYENNEGTVIYMTHAGFTPTLAEPTPQTFDALWSRDHFYDGWDEENFSNVICVHGHTPIQYMYKQFEVPEEKWEYGALHYCGTHKINIDQGTYVSNVACLLDLDTFEEHLFQAE